MFKRMPKERQLRVRQVYKFSSLGIEFITRGPEGPEALT